MRKFTLCSALLVFMSALAHESYVIINPETSRMPIEMPQDMQDLGIEIMAQMAEQGYHSEPSVLAQNLIKYKDKVGTEESILDTDPYFKILRLNTKDFRLSFDFESMPSIPKQNLIGIAPIGSYKGTAADGMWTGLAIFFKHESLGVCRLSVFDMPLFGQAIYDARYVAFDINEKPTVKTVTGTPESGYLYKTSWTGQRFEKWLECTNERPFDRTLLAKLVEYSKVIDGDIKDAP